MSRAIWRGSISFGLVNIAVRLYPATRHLDVRFRELDRATGQRLRHQRVRQSSLPDISPPGLSPAPDQQIEALPDRQQAAPPLRLPHAPTGGEPRPPGLTLPDRSEVAVTADEVVRGFEYEPDRYVTVSAAELESLAPERTRSIDIEQFVNATDLDPIYFDTSYYLVPDTANLRSFAVLLDAMRDTRRLGLGWIVLRRKRHLAALREKDRLMVLTTLFHADEVLPASSLAPPLPEELSSREREMARLLVETLSGPFEPERYRDEYRERLLALLDERTSPHRTPVAEPEVSRSPTGIEELMAALQASVQLAREQKKGAEKAAMPARARRSRRGA